MRFILGPPCGGKGTITSKLDNIPSLSAGNILRKMCKTPEYAHLEPILANGGLVAVDIICDMLVKEAAPYNYDVFIDGFPRNMDQAIEIKKFMEKRNIKNNGVFYIWADKDVLIERTLTRQYCEECFSTHETPKLCCEQNTIRRKDDNIKTLMKRLDIFYNDIDNILKVLEGPVYFIENNNQDISIPVEKIKNILK